MLCFIDTLVNLDRSLLLGINGLHTAFFDGFMFAISAKLTWVPLYLAVLYSVIKYWKREAVWIVLALILCIVIADQVSSGVIKHAVERFRPTHEPDLKGLVHTVNGYVGGRYGFVSSHAANSFGFALLSSLLFRNKNYTFSIFCWAVLLSYSRMYLGVHYPLDIAGGTMVGLVAALICYFTLIKFRPTIIQAQHADLPLMYDKPKVCIILWTLGLSFIAMAVYGWIVV